MYVPIGDKKSMRYGADGRQLTSCRWNEVLARNTWSGGIPSLILRDASMGEPCPDAMTIKAMQAKNVKNYD